jgi:hypothetical protein
MHPTMATLKMIVKANGPNLKYFTGLSLLSAGIAVFTATSYPSKLSTAKSE